MKIADLQREIEESLASVPTSALPQALQGLRHLPLADCEGQVVIRQRRGRKVREDADASYFDPSRCEIVINFVPVAHSDAGESGEGRASDVDRQSDAFSDETATNELVDALENAERTRPFVGLKWFRDQFLPECGYAWARDPRASGRLLHLATDRRLVLTNQVPNPNQPDHPVTAIRVNRRHPRFQPGAPGRRPGFKPIRIRGGSISDTVLGERR